MKMGYSETQARGIAQAIESDIRASVNMVVARLDSEPKTSREWEVIRKHLASAARDSRKLRDFYRNVFGD